MTPMNAKTLEALKASIAKWERNAEATAATDFKIRDRDCPLCELFNTSPDRCKGCPVFETTGEKFCRKTPYIEACAARDYWIGGLGDSKVPRARAHAAARDEVAFLKSLLPAQTEALCSDCPPIGYSTDITRCSSCPRRADGGRTP